MAKQNILGDYRQKAAAAAKIQCDVENALQDVNLGSLEPEFKCNYVQFEQPKIEYSYRSINSLLKSINYCQNKYPNLHIKSLIIDEDILPGLASAIKVMALFKPIENISSIFSIRADLFSHFK